MGYQSWQSSNLLLEQILRLLPDTGIGSVLQLQKTGQQSLAEHLRTFAGKERGQVVDADDAQGWALGACRQGDGHGGLVECRGDIVHGDGVMRVGAVGSG